MAKIGLSTITTDFSIQLVELGPWLEAHGFESLWTGEHSHIPVSRRSPYVAGGELPEYFKRFFDPFIGLSAAAAVTRTLKLGTAVCLPPLHHPAHLAKQAACLDRLSGGRLLLGVGAGWNAEEMADYGVRFEDRWGVTRESVLAMREIWTQDTAEFHGRFVSFDPMWSWPKPVQANGPPVLMGATSKFAPARIADYCDGWVPADFGSDFGDMIAAIKAEMQRRGRSMDELDLTVLADLKLARDDRLETRVRELFAMGFGRVVLRLPVETPDTQWPVLESFARLLARFG